MTGSPYGLPGLSRLWLVLLCALIGLGAGPAMAGWKEVNAALQAGQLSAALPLLRPLAEAGDAEAQYMMGYLLSGASGVKHNLMEAFKWYTVAYAQGQTRAAAARAMIGKRLGPYQAAEGQRQARDWLRRYGMKKAMEATDGSKKSGDESGDESGDAAPIPRFKPERPSS